MNSIKSLIFPQDINKLNNTFLRDICSDLNLESTGSSYELTSRIWGAFENIEGDLLEKIQENIFAGAISLAWYTTTHENGLNGLKDAIIEHMDFNPFEEIRIPDRENIPNHPTIIGASVIDNMDSYFIRFIYKSAVNVDYYLNNRREHARYETITVYVDMEKNVVEVRASSKTSKNIIASLAGIVNEEYIFRQVDFLGNFDNSLERIADEIEGKLIDAIGKPEGLVDAFEDVQGESIVSILSAIDEYYNTNDLTVLEQNLNNEVIESILETTPFTLLLLSGLETVGLGSIRELRGLPLYDYIEPYLDKQKGSILFEYETDGLLQEYSIRIGRHTNTFKFNIFAKEEVLNYIREKLI